MAKSLYIIDGHSHIYSAYYAPMRPLNSPSGEPTKATYIFTTALLGLINTQKPDMLVVTMDSKEKTFRSDLYPAYKANRPPMPDDMPVQIQRIEQILEAMKIPVLRVDGYEADDLIGTLARQGARNGCEVFICSKDKDMLQLIGEHVRIYDMKNNVTTDQAKLEADMKIAPQQFIDVLALQGDTSDNVPGVALVGPGTALQWIQKYGSIDELLAHADEVKGKRGENLRSSIEQLKLSRELVTICTTAPVEFDADRFAYCEPEAKKLASLFGELGFSRLMKQLGFEEQAGETVRVADVSQDQPLGSSGDATNTKHEYVLIDTEEAFENFLKELKKQKTFAIDTETTSINAMQADLVGLSFSWQAHRGFYLPVRTPLGQKCLSLKLLQEKLGPILCDAKIKKIGQNIKYDMLVLRNAKLELRGVSFDTMVAAYCLDAARSSYSMDALALDFLNYTCIPIADLIGKGKKQKTFDLVDTDTACEYAAEDADVTWQLYEVLAERFKTQPDLKKLFDELEMPLVEVLAEMEHVGVSVNIPFLNKMAGELEERLESLREEIYAHAEMEFNIDSPKQLAEVLFDQLALPVIKRGKTSRSTDAGVLEQLAKMHPIAESVLEYRMLTKLKNTYVDKLPSLINARTNRLHASFNQTVTTTGRLSSSNPNLQNIPVRTDIGKKIRAAFVPAAKDECILSADYSQIELRLLAHFSKDQALLEAFERGRDIHAFVASQIYGVDIEDVTDEMRSSCKAVNFGIIYGQGAFGLSKTIGITQAQAKEFIDEYFARYKSIKQFMDGVVDETKKTGFAETILHRRRPIEGIANKNKNKQSQARRLAVNTVIQGSAADLIKVAMLNIHKKIASDKLPIKMMLQIHDELVFELPQAKAEDMSEWIRKEMCSAIDLDVPLAVDIAYGSSWLEAK